MYFDIFWHILTNFTILLILQHHHHHQQHQQQQQQQQQQQKYKQITTTSNRCGNTNLLERKLYHVPHTHRSQTTTIVTFTTFTTFFIFIIFIIFISRIFILFGYSTCVCSCVVLPAGSTAAHTTPSAQVPPTTTTPLLQVQIVCHSKSRVGKVSDHFWLWVAIECATNYVWWTVLRY